MSSTVTETSNVARSNAELEEMLARGEPLYLLDQHGNPVPPGDVNAALANVFLVRGTTSTLFGLANSNQPFPRFADWYLHHVRTGTLPVPTHLLQRALAGQPTPPAVREAAEAYTTLGSYAFYEHYPHLDPWPDETQQFRAQVADRYQSKGYSAPDLQAAFDVDPDPAATVPKPEERGAQPGVRPGLDTTSTGGPLLVSPVESSTVPTR